MKKFYLFLIFFTSFKLIYSQQYILETVVSGLSYPVAFVFLPNNNVLITQKAGLAKIYTLNNVFVSNFWNFTDSTYSGDESGLLGVCLDPNYNTNRYIYFYYVHNNPQAIRVIRLTESSNVGTNPIIIFHEPITYAGHVGGNIRFGPGGKLYISIGDNLVDTNSQSVRTFKGKILRINSNGTIPTDNPFYDDGNPHTGNDDRIWALGLRNSFDFCFSSINDSLYATENGPIGNDEINFIRKGKNYGWPICQGFCNPYNPLYKNPMTVIPGNGFGYAPTGIIIYTSIQMPELTNKLIVVGYGEGMLYRGLLKCDLGNAPFYDTIVARTILMDLHGYTTLMQGSDGFIYALSIVNNVLNRIRSTSGIRNLGTGIPSSYQLYQNYPNPFNPITKVRFDIPTYLKSAICSLKLYDVLSREIATLVNEQLPLGTYEVEWDATNFPSGIYFYTLSAGDFSETRKAVLIK